MPPACLQAALNLDDSPARIDFYGPGLEGAWVTSHTEALYLWDWAAACEEETEGVLPRCSEYSWANACIQLLDDVTICQSACGRTGGCLSMSICEP